MENPLISAELAYNQYDEAALFDERYLQLNLGQKAFVDIVLTAVETNTTALESLSTTPLLFLQSAAGTGKTFTYNVIANRLRSQC